MIHSLPDITGTGSSVQLSSTIIKANWVQVQAISGNSAAVRLGDSGVSSTEGAVIAATGGQFAPPAGNTNCYNLADIWVLIGSGDKIAICYSTI